MSETSARVAHESTSGSRTERAFPTWLPLSALFAILVSLSFRSAGPIDDPDVWWHLRLGEEFRGAWAPGDPGQLSQFATRPWVSTQWLLEVVASHVHDHFQLTGVAWLGGLAVLLLGAMTYSACRQEASTIVAAVATGCGLLGASMSLNPRPQLLSFTLTAVFVAAWLRTTRDHKARWWLVGVSWLWANVHGMWFLGVMIGGLVVLGMALDRSVTRRHALRLAAVPMLGVVATTLTPVGPKLLLAPLATESTSPLITEWQPPDFTSTPAAIITAAMLLLTAWAWARSGQSTPWPRLLLLAMAAVWTVYAYRTIAVGAIVAAPLFAAALQTWSHNKPADHPHSRERRLFTGALAASVILLTVAVPGISKSRGGEVPIRLDADLAALDEGTVVFNSYELGGWLEWRHRNVMPVIDPMADAYPVSYLTAYQDASRVRPGWGKFVASTGAEYALLEVDSSLALALKQRMHWEQRSADSVSGYVLLQAPAR